MSDKKRAITGFPVELNGWIMTAKSHTHTSKGGTMRAMYNSTCPECGKDVIKSRSEFRQNSSCGCTRASIARKRFTTHGDSGTKLYMAWRSMRERSHNSPTDSMIKKYPSHCGKGIGHTVKWDNYDTFKKWALSTGYVDGKSLDRIDNAKGYEPSNCRWTDWNEQMQNQGIRTDSTTGFKGVTFKNGRYVSRIQRNGKRIHLGYFGTAEDAVIARRDYIKQNTKD